MGATTSEPEQPEDEVVASEAPKFPVADELDQAAPTKFRGAVVCRSDLPGPAAEGWPDLEAKAAVEAKQAAMEKARKEAEDAQARARKEAQAAEEKARKETEDAQARLRKEAQAAKEKARKEAEDAQGKARKEAQEREWARVEVEYRVEATKSLESAKAEAAEAEAKAMAEAEEEYRVEAVKSLKKAQSELEAKECADLERGAPGTDTSSSQSAAGGLAEPLLGGSKKDSVPQGHSKTVMLGLLVLFALCWFGGLLGGGGVADKWELAAEKADAARALDTRAASMEEAAEKAAAKRAAMDERMASRLAQAVEEKAEGGKAAFVLAAERAAAAKAANRERAMQRATATRATAEMAAADEETAEEAADQKKAARDMDGR